MSERKKVTKIHGVYGRAIQPVPGAPFADLFAVVQYQGDETPSARKMVLGRWCAIADLTPGAVWQLEAEGRVRQISSDVAHLKHHAIRDFCYVAEGTSAEGAMHKVVASDGPLHCIAKVYHELSGPKFPKPIKWWTVDTALIGEDGGLLEHSSFLVRVPIAATKKYRDLQQAWFKTGVYLTELPNACEAKRTSGLLGLAKKDAAGVIEVERVERKKALTRPTLELDNEAFAKMMRKRVLANKDSGASSN